MCLDEATLGNGGGTQGRTSKVPRVSPDAQMSDIFAPDAAETIQVKGGAVLSPCEGNRLF